LSEDFSASLSLGLEEFAKGENIEVEVCTASLESPPAATKRKVSIMERTKVEGVIASQTVEGHAFIC
jgi:hypothetical protein